jgi:hypothetical protein
MQNLISILFVIIIFITGTTALCEPWPSSEFFAVLPYLMPHSSSSLHPGFSDAHTLPFSVLVFPLSFFLIVALTKQLTFAECASLPLPDIGLVAFLRLQLCTEIIYSTIQFSSPLSVFQVVFDRSVRLRLLWISEQLVFTV